MYESVRRGPKRRLSEFETISPARRGCPNLCVGELSPGTCAHGGSIDDRVV